MSVWCEVSGKVSVRKDRHFSVRKFICDYLDGEDFVVSVERDGETHSLFVDYFRVTIEAENTKAFDLCETLCKEIAAVVSKADLTCEVRWIK